MKLLDFGVARIFKQQKVFDKNELILNTMYTDTGTLSYQAPEMHNNQGYDELVDIWAVGILCYEALT